MFSSSTNCVFVFLILLIFTSICVLGDCGYQQTCRTYFNTWCCPTDQVCGSDNEVCESDSSLSPAVIAIIIVASVFFFVICLTCCIHSTQRQQQSHVTYANSNTRVGRNPYQQSIVRGPVRVIRVRSIYNVGAALTSQSYPSIYEAPPPSYEVATANLPTIHQSSSPVTTTAQ